ncbi:hypothetical protein [Prevotella sp. P6B4]|uniref:hypothetical protein n=1 Tax=Prevotella sp. P6B4 TaxID=1410614 RepID=UPI00048A6CDA|nr:hypothetical protein [Prevotella sp. P6B4]
MKRVKITESQYDGFLKQFEHNDNLTDDDKIQIDNQFLNIELTNVKQTARDMITKAFELGKKYAIHPKDLHLRSEIKQELDKMVQAVDGDQIHV